jgi:hypothetical protein
MKMEQPSEDAVTAWYDTDQRHWRWFCGPCKEQHGTTAIEQDHDGPVQTAIRTHIDSEHPDVRPPIEIRNADGDIDADQDHDHDQDEAEQTGESWLARMIRNMREMIKGNRTK